MSPWEFMEKAPAALLRRTRNLTFNLFSPPVIVLLYHRVADLEHDPLRLAVSAENFRTHLEVISASYPVLRFKDAWSKVGEPSVCITVDDGYRDNFTNALPLLEEFKLPATFFISTAFVEQGRAFWWDEIERLQKKGVRLPQGIHAQMKKMTWEQREDFLRRLCPGHESLRPEPLDAPLTKDELVQLAASPYADIGGHTASHIQLSAFGEDVQLAEMASSRQALMSWTGKKVETFSYPFGCGEDFNETSKTACRKAGFSKAAANIPGQWHPWTDPMAIPRKIVRNWGADEFASKLKLFQYQ